jgi:hypothetical protein
MGAALVQSADRFPLPAGLSPMARKKLTVREIWRAGDLIDTAAATDVRLAPRRDRRQLIRIGASEGPARPHGAITAGRSSWSFRPG